MYGAWSGEMDANPVNYDPKALANAGHALTGAERVLCQADDDEWYYDREEGADYDYNWMMFTYPDEGTPAWALMVWQVNVDHDSNKVQLFYWHGNNQSWQYIGENDGGRDAGTERDNVKAAFENNGDAENVIFLYVGYTPAADEDYIKCDISMVQVP